MWVLSNNLWPLEFHLLIPQQLFVCAGAVQVLLIITIFKHNQVVIWLFTAIGSRGAIESHRNAAYKHNIMQAEKHV